MKGMSMATYTYGDGTGSTSTTSPTDRSRWMRDGPTTINIITSVDGRLDIDTRAFRLLSGMGDGFDMACQRYGADSQKWPADVRRKQDDGYMRYAAKYGTTNVFEMVWRRLAEASYDPLWRLMGGRLEGAGYVRSFDQTHIALSDKALETIAPGVQRLTDGDDVDRAVTRGLNGLYARTGVDNPLPAFYIYARDNGEIVE